MREIGTAKRTLKCICKTFGNIVFTLRLCWSLSKYRMLIIVLMKMLTGMIPVLLMITWKMFINFSAEALNNGVDKSEKCILTILLYCVILLLQNVLMKIADYYFKWESDSLNNRWKGAKC